MAALAVVNSAGSVADERTGVLYGARFGLPGEFDWLVPPSPEELLAGAGVLRLRAGGGKPEPRPPGRSARNHAGSCGRAHHVAIANSGHR